MFGKLFGKKKEAEAKPVTESTPDDWNRADKAAAPAVEGDCSIEFQNLGVKHTVKPGTSILDAAMDAGVDLNNYCGGMCSCGSCRIILVSGNVSEMDDMEEATLSVVEETDDDRLGCQTKILGHVVVTVPPQDF